MRTLLAATLWVLISTAWAGPLSPPEGSRQLVLAVAETLDASHVRLRRYERSGPEEAWQPVGSEVPARVGKNGLAWGRGLHRTPKAAARHKREGDWRAPMGVFRIGDAFGDAPSAPPGTRWAYQQVTENDLWVEDTAAPTYNQHIRVPADRPRTSWEESQRMKMGDPAHRLKVVIHHNTVPDVRPGAGSAIFFHIWRQAGARPTSGCTAMAAADLQMLLGWLEPEALPVYVLIDRSGHAVAQSAGVLP